MSWIPLYTSWGLMIFIISSFLWKLIGFWLFLIYIAFTVIFLIKEVGFSYTIHNWGFLIFILMEFFTFVSLFLVSHYCMAEVLFDGVEYISEFDEFPLLGSIILISSSTLVTGFHFNYGLERCTWYLFFGVVLGFSFIVVQFFEFKESSYYFVDCPYYVAAYSTVGLHFLHVLGGVLVLLIILCVGYSRFNAYYVEMSIWYWHFVDYVWLLVFVVYYYPLVLWEPWSLFFS